MLWETLMCHHLPRGADLMVSCGEGGGVSIVSNAASHTLIILQPLILRELCVRIPNYYVDDCAGFSRRGGS